MKKGQLYKLMGLLEDIKKVDAMIKVHSNDNFMLQQYQAEKDKLVSFLIDELASPSIRSTRSMLTIKLIMDKFYDRGDIKTSPDADEFSQLEMAI